MKKTDYSKIALKYDKNERRKITGPDCVLKGLLEESGVRPFLVLDLGCGTGSYLTFNTEFFKKQDIRWYGIDESDEMLAIAKQKTIIPEFIKGRAEELPYKNGFFDYVTSEFAFHHFSDKEIVLDEITRVIKNQSVFRMKNLEAFCSPGWWIYRYFPKARCEDYKRFWETDLIVYELENRGYSVEVEIKISRKRVCISDIFKTACARDISELNIIDEEEYNTGLTRIKQDVTRNPEAMIMNEFSLLYITARKTGK